MCEVDVRSYRAQLNATTLVRGSFGRTHIRRRLVLILSKQFRIYIDSILDATSPSSSCAQYRRRCVLPSRPAGATGSLALSMHAAMLLRPRSMASSTSLIRNGRSKRVDLAGVFVTTSLEPRAKPWRMSPSNEWQSPAHEAVLLAG
jgi:hypothetical protein